MAKTIEEINDKIQQGKAVVATAEEIIGIVREKASRRGLGKVICEYILKSK